MRRNSCCVKQKLRKGLWSPEEDEKLYNYIKRFGVGCWSSVPKLAGLQRCGKSCRLRWINYLRPDLKRGMFSQEEEDLIISLHQSLGNRWAQISTQLPGRTDNEIKNFWNSSLKKKLMKQGIDPNTHKPIPESQEKDRLDTNSLQAKGLPNLANSSPVNVFASKQAFDPFFLPEFQQSLDPDGFQSNFQNLLRPFEQNPIGNNPIEPVCGFNSLPSLTNFDHQSIIDTAEYSDNSGNTSNLDIIGTSNNTGLFSWDIENKVNSMLTFPFQFIDQSSGHYGNYPVMSSSSSISQELNGVMNLDVFQQI